MWGRKKKQARKNKMTLPHRAASRLYILPTAFGLTFASVVFTLMLTALARHLWIFGGVLILPNMAFLCALLLTHRALGRLSLESVRIETCFAGTPTRVIVQLSTRSKFASVFQCEVEGMDGVTWVTILPRKVTTVILPFTPGHRGHHFIPKLGFSTLYPWGIAQAWTWSDVDEKHWVYPKLQGPSLRWMQANSALASRQGIRGEEMYGLRAYRSGDDRRDIAWKASARSHQLMTRERPRGKTQDDLWLDWKKAPGPLEEKCSAMAKWVVEADRQQTLFGIRLPNQVIPLGRGSTHRQKCLRTLALLDMASIELKHVGGSGK